MNVTSVMNISKTEDCTKDELLEKIKSLKAHNKQLQNIIAKSNKTNSKNNLKRQKSFNFDKCVK